MQTENTLVPLLDGQQISIINYIINSISNIEIKERAALTLYHFAGGSLLSGKDRFAEHSGAMFKGVDAARRKAVPAQRVCFWRCFAALHRLTDAPHRSARCALPNDTPKNKQNGTK
ncbi:hypothetical protein UF64_01755 [Thalassospira sp. HJ]|uniref:hypothetical protein n=1 Tax=Thalassospira sp. HJ TaxID=1616823 RepID=UPI0005CE10B0|nr:hypothetical protein [Thalassospira sp. HJ]KJE37078.1 hypothetical protein UF64_01755 [Thalassospira sp. HJ]